MKKILAFGLMVSTMLSTQNVFAAPATGVTMGVPSHAGSGCATAGSVAASLSPDNSALSILFTGFQAEAGGITGKVKDRQDCRVSIPLTVASGQRLILVRADYRGFHDIPAGGRNVFRHSYGLSDSFGFRRGNTISTYFTGPLSDNYLVQSDSQNVVISGCGTSMTLYMAASVGVSTNRSMASTLATLDSIDITTNPSAATGVTYYLIYQAC